MSSLDAVKKRYNIKEIRIAHWRDPSLSVHPSRAGPKTPLVSPKDASRPFIPKYRVRYDSLPQATDDEDSGREKGTNVGITEPAPVETEVVDSLEDPVFADPEPGSVIELPPGLDKLPAEELLIDQLPSGDDLTTAPPEPTQEVDNPTPATPENQTAEPANHTDMVPTQSESADDFIDPPSEAQNPVGNDIPEAEISPAAEESDERRVSFAPGTPDPTPRKKKLAKGTKGKKKKIAISINSLPPDILAMTDLGLDGLPPPPSAPEPPVGISDTAPVVEEPPPPATSTNAAAEVENVSVGSVADLTTTAEEDTAPAKTPVESDEADAPKDSEPVQESSLAPPDTGGAVPMDQAPLDKDIAFVAPSESAEPLEVPKKKKSSKSGEKDKPKKKSSKKKIEEFALPVGLGIDQMPPIPDLDDILRDLGPPGSWEYPDVVLEPPVEADGGPRLPEMVDSYAAEDMAAGEAFDARAIGSDASPVAEVVVDGSSSGDPFVEEQSVESTESMEDQVVEEETSKSVEIPAEPENSIVKDERETEEAAPEQVGSPVDSGVELDPEEGDVGVDGMSAESLDNEPVVNGVDEGKINHDDPPDCPEPSETEGSTLGTVEDSAPDQKEIGVDLVGDTDISSGEPESDSKPVEAVENEEKPPELLDEPTVTAPEVESPVDGPQILDSVKEAMPDDVAEPAEAGAEATEEPKEAKVESEPAVEMFPEPARDDTSKAVDVPALEEPVTEPPPPPVEGMIGVDKPAEDAPPDVAPPADKPADKIPAAEEVAVVDAPPSPNLSKTSSGERRRADHWERKHVPNSKSRAFEDSKVLERPHDRSRNANGETRVRDRDQRHKHRHTPRLKMKSAASVAKKGKLKKLRKQRKRTD